ncbi:MAG: DUF4167 domain-containing protein [Alphaproteobacteria bacterium]|nr:MAG: DUF4167 domain-containing protein [Alphaproteobacteria bacterium]
MNNPKAARRARGRQQHKGGSPNGRRLTDGNSRADQRMRGNPLQLLEKYKSLARDATTAGDRILAENYFQHADHYQRLVNERASQRASQDRLRKADGDSDTAVAEAARDDGAPRAGANGGEPAEAAVAAEAAEAVDMVATGGDGEAPARPRRRRRMPRPRRTEDSAVQETDDSSSSDNAA